MPISVITDSVASLPKDLIDEYGVDVISLYIIEPDRTTRDLDLDVDAFYPRIAKLPQLPTTSQPSVHDFMEAFRVRVHQGSEVLAVLVSEKMSGTIQSARVAAEKILEELPHARIEILDAESNSMQEGLVVLAAAKLAKAGATMEECIAAGRETIRRTRFIFSPESLENLRKGGRIGRATATLGTLLHITPILTVEHGETDQFGKARSLHKARQKIADTLRADIEKFGLSAAYVHYIGARHAGEEFARNYIQPVVGYMPRVLNTSSVTGIHVGATGTALVYECEAPVR